MQPVVEAAAASAGDRPLQVLEIGSWAGGSAVSWASAIKSRPQSGRILCIDTWKPYFDVDIEHDPLYAEMNAAAEHGDVFRLFLHNLQAAGVADVVDYKVGASRDLLPQLGVHTFDIIYVDGSHHVDDVLCDLSHAVRLIRDGGILCGDDLELEREAVDLREHAAALATGRDFVTAASTGAAYHPGVTEAVAQLVGRVFSWNGFWSARRTGDRWEPLEFQPGVMPSHIEHAYLELVAGDSHPVPELIEESTLYNVVRFRSRYVAILKALGPVSLGVETIGDRDLAPLLLVASSVEELRSRIATYEPAPAAAGIELVDQTAGYNLVRVGSRYLAVSLTLGPVSIGEERIGDRELPPHILTSSSLPELRTRVSAYEQRGTVAE
jgi:predicted O-methyltransferase YrrM